jgi:hypothetical protein
MEEKMSIDAMKQALEALENVRSYDKQDLYRLDEDITALRTAIAEAEKQEPVAWMYDFLNPDNRDEVIRDWTTQDYAEIEREKGFNVRPLYTTPRQWVGLTDQEVEQIANSEYEEAFVRLVEAKLKEKNT